MAAVVAVVVNAHAAVGIAMMADMVAAVKVTILENMVGNVVNGMMADVLGAVGCYHGCCGETSVGTTRSCSGFHHG
jgi:hypothetical protein